MGCARLTPGSQAFSPGARPREPRRAEMLNFASYRKLGTLTSGKRVLFRLPGGPDWDHLLRLFQMAPPEDTRFLKENLKDPRHISDWQENIQTRSAIPLMAEDLGQRRIIATAHLNRGRDASKHIGEIRHIYVSRPFQNQGLGSLMLTELLNLAAMENLRWVKTEVITEHKNAIKAFLSKGFKIKAILDDFFLSEDGATYDVALMTRAMQEVPEDEEDEGF
jgi:RimJ/RimL family protein N-acetyltransferase